MSENTQQTQTQENTQKTTQNKKPKKEKEIPPYQPTEAKIEIMNVADNDKVATFVIRAEGHTMGNSVRYMLMKNKKVEFCGYTIPHPLEDIMNVRVQTVEGTAQAAFDEALTDLMSLSDHVYDVFNKAIDEFQKNKM